MWFKPDLNQPTPKPHAATYAGTSHEPVMHGTPKSRGNHWVQVHVQRQKHLDNIVHGGDAESLEQPRPREFKSHLKHLKMFNLCLNIFKYCLNLLNVIWTRQKLKLKSTYSDRSTWMTTYTAETQKVSNMARTQKVSNMMCVMRSPRAFRITSARCRRPKPRS